MSTQSDFLIWTHKVVPGGAALQQLKNVDDDWELPLGISRAQGWPDDAKYPMDPETPNDTLLTDSLFNTDALLVVSPRLKDFLEAQKVATLEYLPVTIVNHKKKPVKPGYFIANPLDPIHCLDAAKSGVTFSVIDPTAVIMMKHLIIDESKVPADRSMFRVFGYTLAILLRRKVAEALLQQGFTGVRFLELHEYPEH